MLDHLVEAEAILVPVIVLGELHAAFRGGRRATENLRALGDFLGEPEVRTVPVTARTAERYGLVLQAQRAAGRPVPTNDLWIAAVTLENGGHLLTFDSDFGHIAALAVTVLPPRR